MQVQNDDIGGMTDKELEADSFTLGAHGEQDTQGVDGLLGWSEHPQRLPSRDANGSFAGCSPQFCARN